MNDTDLSAHTHIHTTGLTIRMNFTGFHVNIVVNPAHAQVANIFVNCTHYEYLRIYARTRIVIVVPGRGAQPLTKGEQHGKLAKALHWH